MALDLRISHKDHDEVGFFNVYQLASIAELIDFIKPPLEEDETKYVCPTRSYPTRIECSQSHLSEQKRECNGQHDRKYIKSGFSRSVHGECPSGWCRSRHPDYARAIGSSGRWRPESHDQ